MKDYHGTTMIEVTFHTAEQERLYDEALTGNDTDVLLAAEKAINAALGISYYDDESPIWLAPE